MKNEVSHRVKEERNMIQTIKRKKVKWFHHIWRRNCLLKHIIEANIEGKRRRGRRHEQLLNDLKENKRYWNMKEQALDHTPWTTRFRRGYGPVVRQAKQWMNSNILHLRTCLRRWYYLAVIGTYKRDSSCSVWDTRWGRRNDRSTSGKYFFGLGLITHIIQSVSFIHFYHDLL